MSIRLRLILSALAALAIASVASAQNWHYFGIDAADQTESLLHNPDLLISLPQEGKRSPLWKIYYDEAPREHLDCQRFQSIQLSAQVRDPLLSVLKQGDADILALLTQLRSADEILRANYMPGRRNTFAGTAPMTANLPEHSDGYDTSWLSDQFLFCDEDAAGDALLYSYAFGNAGSLSKDWRFTNDLQVTPERWQTVSQHPLSKSFEPFLALIRQGGIMAARGGKTIQRDISVSSWAGEYGLYPALAWFLTYYHAPEGAYQRLSLSAPLDRPHLLPMDVTQPFVDANVSAPQRSELDESKYSNAPLFFFLLAMYSNLAEGDVSDWLALAAQPVSGQSDVLAGLDKRVRTAMRNPNAGLDTAFAHFASHYIQFQERLGVTSIDDETWQAEMFGECQPVEVSEFRVIAFEDVSLPRFSAQCFKLFIGADHRPWQGQANVRLTGASEAVQEVSISVGAISKNDEELIRCKADFTRPSKDCLVEYDQTQFEDGRAARFARLDLPQEDRSGDLPVFKVGETYEVLLILSRVPAAPNASHTKATREAEAFSLAITTDAVSAENGLEPDGNWTTRYRLKQPGMSPGPIRQWDMAGMDEMITGRADGVLGQNFVNLDQGDALIISNDKGDQLTLSAARPWNPNQALETIEIEGDETVLSQKKTGTFPAYGSVVLRSQNKELSYQDLRRPSQVKIIEHSENALTFEATLNVCVEDSETFVADLQTLAQRQMEIFANAPQTYEGQEAAKDAAEDLEDEYRSGKCNDALGRSETFTFSGSIPYPDSWTEDGQWDAWDTPELQRHTDYIQERRRYLMSGGPVERQIDTNTPTGRALARLFGLEVAQSVNASGPPAGLCQAPIYTDAEGCSCTCSAKLCLDQKVQSQTASGAESSCNLFCFADWQSC